ncbi:hypothetical protein ACI2KG_00375 [Pseudomonas sp. NPDC089407]|uniref:hypothetical protein n=1 Tax=Pseudomonas sp. NPDC089407 TaxID=3364464 RepID=UPI0038503A45
MKSIQERTDEAFKDAEVVDALKKLSQYGFGILLVHGHNEKGEFTELPKGVAAYEENLQITFKGSSEENGDFVPVAWVWDGEMGKPVAVMKCNNAQWCEDKN